MPTRFNSKSQVQFGVVGINADIHQGTADLTISPVGIEDVDIALFNLFENEIKLQVSGKNSDPKKVPVIFAAGEKWALLKKKRALRDKNNSLILPLVTIARTSVSQDLTGDITGRGINQQTSEIIIHRRLDKTDRNYQNIINRYLLKNQKNVATNPGLEHVDDQLLTDQPVGKDVNDPVASDGAWLADIKKNNVYETIVVPTPQFCTINYEITMWTQYTQHMNQLIEQIISSFLPQGNTWKIDTQKGYWFLAMVEDNSYTPDGSNLDEMGQSERIIKYKFNVNVKSYIFASQYPGVGIPIKRYVSSPIVSFDVAAGDGPNLIEDSSGIIDPFLGSDDPTLPLSAEGNRRLDQRRTGVGNYDPRTNPSEIVDPALASRSSRTNLPYYKKIVSKDLNGNTEVKYVRIYKVNQKAGETIIKPGSDSSSTTPLNAEALLGGLTYHITKDF